MTDAQRKEIHDKMVLYLKSREFKRDFYATFPSTMELWKLALSIPFARLKTLPKHTLAWSLIFSGEKGTAKAGTGKLFRQFQALAGTGQVVNTYVVVQNVIQTLLESPFITSLTIGNFNGGKDDALISAQVDRLVQVATGRAKDPQAQMLGPYFQDLDYKFGKRRFLPPEQTNGVQVIGFDFLVKREWLGRNPGKIPCFADPQDGGLMWMIPPSILKEVLKDEYGPPPFIPAAPEQIVAGPLPPLPGSLPPLPTPLPQPPPFTPEFIQSVETAEVVTHEQVMRVLEQVIRTYVDNDFIVVMGGPDPSNEHGLIRFEQEFGNKFPDDFKHFIKGFGSIHVEAKEEVWPKAKMGEVHPAWTFDRRLCFFGFGEDIPEHLDLHLQTKRFQEETGTRFMPFMRIGHSADPYLFDERGTVLIWDHETNTAKPVELLSIQIFQDELKKLKEKKNRIKSNPELFKWPS